MNLVVFLQWFFVGFGVSFTLGVLIMIIDKNVIPRLKTNNCFYKWWKKNIIDLKKNN